MGSQVSPIVANLCMEVIEELAITTSSVPPKVWKRYVNDSFVIIKKDAVTSFHNTLNASDPKISFTIELENNGQIAFLDTLISRRNGGRCFKTRRKEHQRNLKNYAKGSNVANDAWQKNHSIDFDNACLIDKGNITVSEKH